MLTSSPEDYGLDDAGTLAHAVAVDPPADLAEYWAGFDEEVAALPPRWGGAINETLNEVVIPSVRAVRVVARVALPEEPARGIVVTTHGSGAPDAFPDAPEPWTARGLVTVRLRVRGYPPSTLDVDDVRADWILHRFPLPDAWIVRGAVADVVQACRCAHQHFGGDLPVMLHGESLGGGLAVIAGARLQAGGIHGAPAPARIALGLPSFGDWHWREDRYCNGTGARINEYLTTLRREREAPRRTLQLFDAAHHARSIACPVLCKLALRDDVVPAPSAAAIFNALGGERARFLTRYGHFDGGLEDARRHAWFERLHPAFLDPACEPEAVAEEMAPRSALPAGETP